MLTVNWVKPTSGPKWFALETYTFDSVTSEGVYVIWFDQHRIDNTVKVGQGIVADRLRSHQADQEILAYRQFGTLLVTWADVSVWQRGGVELFLAEYYRPRIGERYPIVLPIEVNLPV